MGVVWVVVSAAEAGWVIDVVTVWSVKLHYSYSVCAPDSGVFGSEYTHDWPN